VVWINKTPPFEVGEIGIADSYAHNVLKRGMKPGDSLMIESTVGVMTRLFDDPLTNFIIILTVGMFHDNETPDNAVTAGYDAFQSTLKDEIKSHLVALNSPDQSVVDQARQQIADAVAAAITSAISNSLSIVQKGEVAIGILTLDSEIGSASTSFSNLVDTNFTLTIGDPLGGRLLYYVDASQAGGGDVSSPKVIGQGGWQQFKFLFAGGNNVIYAVNQQGQLLRYVDASQTGGGDVSSPQVIGQGGWLQFKFLFGGGNNVIYAVNQQGELLRYVDGSQSGGGDVSSPQVIGQGGWLPFLFLFSGWNNVIYAVDQQGELLRYVDGSQTGGGDVSSPQIVGRGGWQQFGFLFGGGNNVIYAAEKALYPAHNYEIAGTLTVAAVLCVDERAAVNQATQALNSAKSIVQELQAEFQQATGAQKQELRAEITAAQKDVAAAQDTLDTTNKALQACLARSQKPIPTRPVRRG